MLPKLFRHAAIYTVINALNSAIPLLLLPILTRYLNPSEYGLIAMFSVLSAIVAAIAGLGTHGAVTREFFLRNKKEFAEFVGTCILILLISSFFLCAGILLFNKSLTNITGIPKIWLVSALIMGASQILSSIGLAILQVRKLPIIYGVFQVTLSVTNIILSIVLVEWVGLGWVGRVIGQIIPSLGISLLMIVFLINEGWIRLSFSRDKARDALRYGLPLVFHALGATAVATSDRSFITNLVSAHETGLYFVGAQLAMTITFLADSFNRAYAPWLFEKLKEGNSEMMHRIQLGTYFYYAVIFLITALLILAGPLILKLIAGPKFFGASQYIFWLALANAFGSMYYMESLRIQFNGKTEYLAFITLTIGTLNILLCYFMTLREGAIGAAKATTISQLLIFLITWLVATKLIKNKMN